MSWLDWDCVLAASHAFDELELADHWCDFFVSNDLNVVIGHVAFYLTTSRCQQAEYLLFFLFGNVVMESYEITSVIELHDCLWLGWLTFGARRFKGIFIIGCPAASVCGIAFLLKYIFNQKKLWCGPYLNMFGVIFAYTGRWIKLEQRLPLLYRPKILITQPLFIEIQPNTHLTWIYTQKLAGGGAHEMRQKCGRIGNGG